MIRTAQVFGFVLIASVAFGTAAGISAVGDRAVSMDAGSTLKPSAPEPGPYGFGDRMAAVDDACTVEFMAGERGMHRVALQLETAQSIDLDGPASSGITISCATGAGASVDAAAIDTAAAEDVVVVQGDRL